MSGPRVRRLDDRGLRIRHAIIAMLDRNGRLRRGAAPALARHFSVTHQRIYDLTKAMRSDGTIA